MRKLARLAGIAARLTGRRGAWVVAAGAVVVVSLAVVTWGVRRSATARLAYVASAGNNHVQVIDLTTGRTLRKIYTGTTPWRLVVAPDRKSLWVQHWYAATTTVVALDDHEVRGAFASRGPGTFSASGDQFLTFDWPASTLRRFRTSNFELLGEESTEIRNVYDVAPDPKDPRLFLAQHDPMIQGPHDRYSYVLAYAQTEEESARRPSQSYRTGQSPIRIRTLARGDFLLSADSETNGLTLINRLGDRRTVPTCRGPQNLVVSRDETRLIVTCSPPPGGAKSRVVSYRTEFLARPWPTIAEEASRDLQGAFSSGSFSPAGDRVYLTDRANARLVELDPKTLRQQREFPTGDVPLDVVVLEVPENVRESLVRDEGRARAKLMTILSEMKAGSRPLADLAWTETLEPPKTDATGPEGSPARRKKLAFRAPSSLRAEADDGSVRLAEGGHSMSIDPEGRFWVGPRQDLMAALLSIWALPVDQAIRELAGDVPGSPYLRGGLAVDLMGEVREQGERYYLIGTLQPKQRVSQLWIDADRRRPTNLAEQFPSFAADAHAPANPGGILETKFYDFVTTATGANLPTRLERVIAGRGTQTVRVEYLKEAGSLARVLFDLGRLGGSMSPLPADDTPPSVAALDPSVPGRAMPIMTAAYLKHPGEPHAPYNTNPPTSGPRLHSLAEFGPHKLPVPPELQVHNLEHGGVLIQYNCPELCPDLVAKLEAVAKTREFVLVAPYPPMSTRIALTAWGRIETLDELDMTKVQRFIDAHAGKDHHDGAHESVSALEH